MRKGSRKHIGKLLFMLAFGSMMLSGVASNGQVEKANEYYENFQLSKAIDLYKKALKKEPNNFEALKKLGIASLRIHQYEQAEMYLARAYKHKHVDETTMLAYGRALKQNKKLDQAKVVFQALAEKNPDLGKRFVFAVKKVSEWEGEEKAYSVSNFEALNTPDAEFSAVKFNGNIVFVAERNKDFVNYHESGINEQPYLSVYVSEEKEGEYRKPKLFENSFNDQLHTGPVSFSSDSKTAFLTRVVKTKITPDKINVSRPQIFIAKKDGKNWEEPQPFAFNNEDYSLAHPAVSADGKKLFFTSDMPGGQGGKDLYISEWNGSEWSKPKNLGPEINTQFDEMFPYVHSDGILYFSSNGHAGYGGLDIFASSYKGSKWQSPENQKSPINSPADDFAIFFSDEKSGWFSSNREGGVGSDDIYSFERVVKDIPSTTITGIFEYEKLPADETAIWLVDENDVKLSTVTTDEKGAFQFENLEPDKNYMLMIEEFDGDLSLTSAFLTNDKGQKVVKLVRKGDRFFAFQALPRDEYNQLTPIIEEDGSLLNISVYGKVYEKIPGDVPEGINVSIVDEDGNLRFSTTTTEGGNFEFNKLPPDQTYILKLDDKDGDLKMLILSEKGEMIKSLKEEGDEFVYERIEPDEAMITLLDENDVVLRIKEDENFIIGNIYYDYDSWKINDAAKKELDKLAVILKKNPHIGAELSSHTDSRSSDKYNLTLSEKRAKAATEYIVTKGIDKTQIIGKGYGETKLVNKCDDGVECTEEEHAKNRRTEFKIYNRK